MSPKAKPKRLLLLFVLLFLVASVWAFLSYERGAPIYSYDVGEAVRLASEGKAERVGRVTGVLASGSIREQGRPCRIEFQLRSRDDRARVVVRYPSCTVPDRFCDVPGRAQEVVAEGRVFECGRRVCVDADQIFVKYGGKYEFNAEDPCRAATWRPALVGGRRAW